MDLLTGLVVVLAAVAMVSLVVSPGTPRVLDLFAAGFLPYRDRNSGWPQGVQEEEPIPWVWTKRQGPDRPDGGSEESLAAPELVDISGDAVLATRVGGGSMARGLARRRR